MAKNGELARIDELVRQHDKKLDAIDARFDKIDAKLDRLALGVSKINGGLMLFGAAFVIVAGWIFYTGENTVREIAREVAREESAYRQSLTQDGKMSPDNKVPLFGASDEVASVTFHWDLVVPADPAKLLTIRVETRMALPGVAMTADLDADGKGCTMTLTGKPDVINALKLPIDATVTIEMRS